MSGHILAVCYFTTPLQSHTSEKRGMGEGEYIGGQQPVTRLQITSHGLRVTAPVVYNLGRHMRRTQGAQTDDLDH